MKKHKQKDRILKFSEREVLALLEVTSSILRDGHLKDDHFEGVVQQFADVYVKFDRVGNAIIGSKPQQELSLRHGVINGLGHLNDRYYALQELIDDGTIEGFEFDEKIEGD